MPHSPIKIWNIKLTNKVLKLKKGLKKRIKELEPATWSEPVAFPMTQLDTDDVVSKATDWSKMLTLACVGLQEDRSAFHARFNNTAAFTDDDLAQSIKPGSWVRTPELPVSARAHPFAPN